jgi:hypothetical protein
MPAKDAYTGQGFRMLRHRLELDRSPWCILSALYGFIWPDTFIEDYNVKMRKGIAPDSWPACFDHLTPQQRDQLVTAESITILGSKLYADAAAALLKRHVHAPFAGLPIGKLLGAVHRGEWRRPSLLPV